MKKNQVIIILSLTILLLTGCKRSKEVVGTIDYNLYIDKTFKENINFILPKNAYELSKKNIEEDTNTSLETSLLKEDNYPIFSNQEEKYEKEIKKNTSNVKVTLDYNYLEKDFVYSNYITNCFENYKVNSTEDYFELDLDGEFYCLHDRTINITIDSIHKVKESNGTTNNDDVYSWTINKDNYKNVDIYYKLSRKYSSMSKEIPKKTTTTQSNKIAKRLKTLFGAAVLAALLLIFRKFYRNTI